MTFNFIDRKFAPKPPVTIILECDCCNGLGWIDQSKGAGIGVACDRWVVCPDCRNPEGWTSP